MTPHNPRVKSAIAFLEALARGDIEEMGSLTTNNFTIWIIGNLPLSGVHNRERFFGMVGPGQLWAEPMTFSILGTTAEAERVAVEAKGNAVTVTRRQYENYYHFLFKFEGERIIELREYTDSQAVVDAFSGDDRFSR